MALKNKLKAKWLFCDVEKAFDCVNHNILLYKLEIHGITDVSKKLYSQYLMDRYQHVNLQDRLTPINITSNWSKIQQGVPQGSVLVPCCFCYTSTTYLSLLKIMLYQSFLLMRPAFLLSIRASKLWKLNSKLYKRK
jgi:hypothetical protein